MKILFINFNLGATAGINNGIAILSAVLKRHQHNVELIFLCEELGYGFDLARIREDIEKANPDIIGLSLMEPQRKYAVKLCRDLMTYYKRFVICGGPYPTMDPEGVLSIQGVNAVCIGEGEDALLELANAMEKNLSYTHIKNLWFRLSDSSVVRNRLRPFKDLSLLPAEDKELFDLEKILPLKGYQLETMLGRGCSYRCTYCINHAYLRRYRQLCDGPVSIRNYLRTKNPDTVLAEIKDAISKHHQIRKIAFIDDNLLTYDDLENLCLRLKHEIGLPFICNVNPRSFNSAKGRLLRDCGCDIIRFGVESGSERVKREIMKRPMSNRSVAMAAQTAAALGLTVSFYNMIGLPTETKDEVLETLRLNASLRPSVVKLMTFYPFKNTSLYDLCANLNLIDFDQKEVLDNYDTFTCLRFSDPHRLFLEKVQTAFNWYINSFLDNAAGPRYKALVDSIEGMTEETWGNFDFPAADAAISAEMKRLGICHYTKFVNRSLAIKYAD